MSAIQTVTRCVIDDVVNNLRESFKREGIDESVLSDLQKLWEQKMAQTMAATGAVGEASSSDIYAEEKTNKKKRTRRPATNTGEYTQANEFALPPFNQMSALLPEAGDDVVEGVPSQPEFSDLGKPSPYMDPALYSQQYAQHYPPQVYYPPHQLHYAAAAAAAQQQLPSAMHLQQHLQYPQYAMPTHQAPPQTFNPYLRHYAQQQQQQQTGEPSAKRQRVNPNEVHQVDGTDDDDLGDLGEELNSEDDDDEDDFVNTDDLLFALADKVSRTKNKWKCSLKYGIMTLKGRDYAFNKATGDFEW